MARGLAACGEPLTVVVNVGDDEEVYGVHVSPDLDTVASTLAGREGPEGWGVAGDTFTVLGHLERLGADTSFRLGDADLALNLLRTEALRRGERLSAVTARLAAALGVGPAILPATDDRLRTRVRVADGTWLPFQEYFVLRRHRDPVAEVRYDGAAEAGPAPGVVEAIDAADVVVVAPSNPPLSIWPILAVPGVREAVARRPTVAVSPLFGGRALKGPADRVMTGIGLPPGNAGVVAAYPGLIDVLVIDRGDAADAEALASPRLRVLAADTRIAEPTAAAGFAAWLLDTVA
jgi:LPPG:FO 2-phospho-L-lactate transferase